MNPLDAIDPNITDEKLAEFYGTSFMCLVRDDYPISAVRNDDKIWAHQWLTTLMLQIEECKCEDRKLSCDCLSEWDRIPDKVSDLHAEVKRLREALVGDSNGWTTDELVEKALTLYDKALVFDAIYDWHTRMQLQGEGIAHNLDRMEWMIKNPDKEYEDFDKEYDEE